jgi:hypothetical protein
MKHFDTLAFQPEQARKEVLELHDLLAAKKARKEQSDFLPFFRQRPQLSALCGSYNSYFTRLDRIAWEYDVFGDFTCDIAVGDSVRKTFAFIEFEDAGPRSLFVRKGKKATREWSPRFDHGSGQLIDWFCKLHDRRGSDEFEVRFGKRSIDFMGILVIGRNHYMDAGERLRLEWRREHVVVHSRKVHCVTFDELLEDLLARLQFASTAEA